jgi:hypothetical protein
MLAVTVLKMCSLVIDVFGPVQAAEIITTMNQRLFDFEIWHNDFKARYHRDPTPDEIMDGFATDRWPLFMVKQMKSDLDAIFGQPFEAGGLGLGDMP